MASIENVVKVMNFHSLIRVDKAKKEASKYFSVEDELIKLLYQIYDNKNLKLDKKILLENPNGIVLNIYIGNDLGFCGNFNHLLRKAIKEDEDSYKIIIGKKTFFTNDEKILLKIEKGKFLDEYPKIDNMISKYIKEKKLKAVNVIYNHYYTVNDIKFETKKLFPVTISKDLEKEVDLDADYVIETDVNEFLSNVISLCICYQIKIFESNSFASENVMRERITRESIKKIDEINENNFRKELKDKKEKNFKKEIDNYKNLNRS